MTVACMPIGLRVSRVRYGSGPIGSYFSGPIGFPFSVDPPMPAVDHAGAGHPAVRREAVGDGVRAQEIVGIEKDDEARARLSQACVSGGCEAGVGLPYEPHTKVARGD